MDELPRAVSGPRCPCGQRCRPLPVAVARTPPSQYLGISALPVLGRQGGTVSEKEAAVHWEGKAWGTAELPSLREGTEDLAPNMPPSPAAGV